MEFSAEHCKNSLDFALAGDDASLDESGNLDHGSSSSSHFSDVRRKGNPKKKASGENSPC